MTIEMETDVVIVGAGSAGCVVARRLSDDPRINVTLIEAGERSNNFFTDIPGMTVRLMGNPQADWCYMAEPDPTLGGRQLSWNGGRMLGGSSSINGLVYIRGLQRDYNDWAAAGCTGWAWHDVEPYFRKAEGFEDGGLESLGSDGPYTISRIRSLHPLTPRFVDACAQVGIASLADYSRGDRDGAFVNLTSQARGVRSSTANRYLAPVLPRQNLQILRGAMADKVLFEESRACGVRVHANGETLIVRARAQVVISAGTLQSPGLLMRSGLGPAPQLREVGIDVRCDMPGVGRNLQEHCGVTISRFTNVPTYNSQTGPLQAARHLVNYLLFRRGPLASAAVQGMAWARSDPKLPECDITLNWLPYGIDYTVVPPVMHKRPAVSLGVCVARPNARGEIRLRSREVREKPIIDHHLLGDERDLQTIFRSLALMERVFDAPALASAFIQRCSPECFLQTDKEFEAFARAQCGIGYHAVGSCAMGSSTDAVLDPELRVRGVERLRVIDASVMPRLVSGNTNAASIMIGEKGADLVARSLRGA